VLCGRGGCGGRYLGCSVGEATELLRSGPESARRHDLDTCSIGCVRRLMVQTRGWVGWMRTCDRSRKLSELLAV
jgi:hypothetical protein